MASRHRFAALCLGLLAGPVGAAEPFTEHTLRLAPGEASPPASIDAMAWMAGTWRTPAFGGVGEESWLPPAEGSMAGVFRQHTDEGVRFYEILVIREQDDSLLLQLRHFDAGLVAWEARAETVDFPLAAIGTGRIDFEGMSFRPLADDAMTVYLAVDEGRDEVRFDYVRVAAPGIGATRAD